MSNVCSLLVCCLARLWFMALLLCCLLPQIPIAIHGQELSMSGPDATKIRHFHDYSHGCHRELQHRSHCFVHAPGFFWTAGNRHWAHTCTWGITWPSPSPLSALGCLSTPAPAQGHHHLPIGGVPGPAQPSPPPPPDPDLARFRPAEVAVLKLQIEQFPY